MNNGISEPFRDGISEPFYDGVSGGGHSVVLGPELILDNDFSDGTTSIAGSGTSIEVANNQLVATTTEVKVFVSLRSKLIHTLQKGHKIRFKIELISTSAEMQSIKIVAGVYANPVYIYGPQPPGTYETDYTVPGEGEYIWFYTYFNAAAAVGLSATIANVSAKEYLIV